MVASPASCNAPKRGIIPLFNLEALFDAASIADKLGMDLWNYETQDKRGIRKALDWLLPFADRCQEVELSTDLSLAAGKTRAISEARSPAVSRNVLRECIEQTPEGHR